MLVGFLDDGFVIYSCWTSQFFLSLSSNVISHVAYDVVRQLVNRAPCTPFFFSPFCQLESKLYLFGSHYRVYHITSFRLLEDSLTFCLTIMLYPKSLALWNRTLHDLTILTWDKPSPSFFLGCCCCSHPCPCPRRPDSTWHRLQERLHDAPQQPLDFMVKVRPFCKISHNETLNGNKTLLEIPQIN